MATRNRSLKSQLQYAVRECFRPGMSKHSAKQQMSKEERQKINFSYKSRDEKLDVAKNFANWEKTAHPEVHMVRDIKPSHINEFLREKAESGCAQATLNGYASSLRSIALQCAETYKGVQINAREIVTPKVDLAKIRTMPLDREDRDRLMVDARDRPRSDTLSKGLEISRACGARADEIVYVRREDIAADGSSVHLEGKGGRERTVHVYDEKAREKLIELREKTLEGDRVVPIKADSLEQALRRSMERIGISGKYDDTGFHAARKLWARDRYDFYRKELGLSISEASGLINLDLGHSYERVGLLETYIGEVN